MRLALGSAQFGMHYGISNETGQVGLIEIKRILSECEKAGIDLIDTAISYGDSERVLGQTGVQQFRIVTKIPGVPDGTENVATWVRREVEGSLDRLKVPHLYGLLMHQSAMLLQSNAYQVVQAMQDLKKAGIVQKLGMSLYNPCELNNVKRLFKPDLVQLPLNVLDRRFEERGWLKILCSEGVEIHSRSSFLQGLLLMKRTDIPSKFGRWRLVWDSWHSYLDATGVKACAACLNYPLNLPEVDRVVVGVTSAAQLIELLRDTKNSTGFEQWPGLANVDQRLINPSLWARL